MYVYIQRTVMDIAALNSLKVEISQISLTKEWEKKELSDMHATEYIPCNNENKGNIATHKHIKESQKQIPEPKKPHQKIYILYNFT